jgi:hypothetical protein
VKRRPILGAPEASWIVVTFLVAAIVLFDGPYLLPMGPLECGEVPTTTREGEPVLVRRCWGTR